MTTKKALNTSKRKGKTYSEEDTEKTLDLMYFLSEHIVKKIKSILRKKERIRNRLKKAFFISKKIR